MGAGSRLLPWLRKIRLLFKQINGVLVPFLFQKFEFCSRTMLSGTFMEALASAHPSVEQTVVKVGATWVTF